MTNKEKIVETIKNSYSLELGGYLFTEQARNEIFELIENLDGKYKN